MIIFLLQQMIKAYLSKKTNIENYRHAIDNYIDYVCAGAKDAEIIVLAKNLFFPTEGPYIKECQTKIFKEKAENIKDLLMKYKRDEIKLVDLHVELKKLKFKKVRL